MQRDADEASSLNMAFFRSVTLSDLTPTISGDGVLLRPAQMSDCSAWIRLREESREFLVFAELGENLCARHSPPFKGAWLGRQRPRS